MVVKPRIRGFICTTAHPVGCLRNVQDQIRYVTSRPPIVGAKNVLVVGCSTGYGLASRVSVAFGCRANTLGFSLEKEPEAKRTGSAGWYNNLAFDSEATRSGLFAKTINGDAFSNEVKRQAIDVIRNEMAPIDLVVYSLASPVRTHPTSGEAYRSSIKPIGKPLQSRTLTLDVLRDRCNVNDIDLEPASESEIASTIAVMGGEDWGMWVDELQQAQVLADSCKTIAYTYLGNELTEPIYRGGTLGRAKEDLDRTRDALNTSYGDEGMEALVAVLKAVVTQASTAIPVVPLYFSILFKIMKEHGTHEDCIAHMYRLFSEQVFKTPRRIDESDRIRMDNYELSPEIQTRVKAVWETIDTTNARDLADIEGFRSDFLKLFGFGRSDVDYDEDVDPRYIVP